LRPGGRLGPDGESITDVVIEITQRRRGYLRESDQTKADHGDTVNVPHDFWFRGGCTILFDPENQRVRYVIGKGIMSERRLKAQRRHLAEHYGSSLRATYFQSAAGDEEPEPFAMLHRSYDPQGTLR